MTTKCAKCGCERIIEWQMVPIGYTVIAIEPDGTCQYSESRDRHIADELSTTDCYACDECGHSSTDARDFAVKKAA